MNERKRDRVIMYVYVSEREDKLRMKKIGNRKRRMTAVATTSSTRKLRHFWEPVWKTHLQPKRWLLGWHSRQSKVDYIISPPSVLSHSLSRLRSQTLQPLAVAARAILWMLNHLLIQEGGSAPVLYHSHSSYTLFSPCIYHPHISIYVYIYIPRDPRLHYSFYHFQPPGNLFAQETTRGRRRLKGAVAEPYSTNTNLYD